MNNNIIIPLLSQYGLFIHTCVSKIQLCLKMWFSNFLWYNVIRWSSRICKKSSFLSFYSFLVKFSGSERVKLTKCESWMGWKMLLCKWHTLWMAPCLICYFILILLYIERPSYEKCSHNLTLEVQIVWKISLF